MNTNEVKGPLDGSVKQTMDLDSVVQGSHSAQSATASVLEKPVSMDGGLDSLKPDLTVPGQVGDTDKPATGDAQVIADLSVPGSLGEPSGQSALIEMNSSTCLLETGVQPGGNGDSLQQGGGTNKGGLLYGPQETVQVEQMATAIPSTCSHCGNSYEDPCMLECEHILCRWRCVNPLVKNKVVICPLCETICFVESGVENLPSVTCGPRVEGKMETDDLPTVNTLPETKGQEEKDHPGPQTVEDPVPGPTQTGTGEKVQQVLDEITQPQVAEKTMHEGNKLGQGSPQAEVEEKTTNVLQLDIKEKQSVLQEDRTENEEATHKDSMRDEKTQPVHSGGNEAPQAKANDDGSSSIFCTCDTSPHSATVGEGQPQLQTDKDTISKIEEGKGLTPQVQAERQDVSLEKEKMDEDAHVEKVDEGVTTEVQKVNDNVTQEQQMDEDLTPQVQKVDEDVTLQVQEIDDVTSAVEKVNEDVTSQAEKTDDDVTSQVEKIDKDSVPQVEKMDEDEEKIDDNVPLQIETNEDVTEQVHKIDDMTSTVEKPNEDLAPQAQKVADDVITQTEKIDDDVTSKVEMDEDVVTQVRNVDEVVTPQVQEIDDMTSKVESVNEDVTPQAQKMDIDVTTQLEKVNKDLAPQIQKMDEDMTPQAEKLDNDVTSQVEKNEDVAPQAEKINEDMTPQLEKMDENVIPQVDKTNKDVTPQVQDIDDMTSVVAKVNEDVTPQVQKMDGDVTLKAEKIDDNKTSQVEKNVDVAQQTEKIDDLTSQVEKNEDVAPQAEKIDDDLTSQVEKMDEDLAQQTEKIDDDLTSQVEKMDEDVVPQVEKVDEDVTLQTEKIDDNVTSQVEKNEDVAQQVQKIDDVIPHAEKMDEDVTVPAEKTDEDTAQKVAVDATLPVQKTDEDMKSEVEKMGEDVKSKIEKKEDITSQLEAVEEDVKPNIEKMDENLTAKMKKEDESMMPQVHEGEESVTPQIQKTDEDVKPHIEKKEDITSQIETVEEDVKPNVQKIDEDLVTKVQNENKDMTPQVENIDDKDTGQSHASEEVATPPVQIAQEKSTSGEPVEGETLQIREVKEEGTPEADSKQALVQQEEGNTPEDQILEGDRVAFTTQVPGGTQTVEETPEGSKGQQTDEGSATQQTQSTKDEIQQEVPETIEAPAVVAGTVQDYNTTEGQQVVSIAVPSTEEAATNPKAVQQAPEGPPGVSSEATVDKGDAVKIQTGDSSLGTNQSVPSEDQTLTKEGAQTLPESTQEYVCNEGTGDAGISVPGEETPSQVTPTTAGGESQTVAQEEPSPISTVEQGQESNPITTIQPGQQNDTLERRRAQMQGWGGYGGQQAPPSWNQAQAFPGYPMPWQASNWMAPGGWPQAGFMPYGQPTPFAQQYAQQYNQWQQSYQYGGTTTAYQNYQYSQPYTTAYPNQQYSTAYPNQQQQCQPNLAAWTRAQQAYQNTSSQKLPLSSSQTSVSRVVSGVSPPTKKAKTTPGNLKKVNVEHIPLPPGPPKVSPGAQQLSQKELAEQLLKKARARQGAEQTARPRGEEEVPAKKAKLDPIGSSSQQAEVEQKHYCIGNLPAGTKATDLRDFLSSFGKVVTCKVAVAKGKNAGIFGFVTMEITSTAGSLVSALSGFNYGGSKITVKKMKSAPGARST